MDPLGFAKAWEQGWNSHDLSQIMHHYRDDIIFRSQKAVPLIGHGEIHGKQALRSYWAAALEKQPDLKFQINDIFEGYEMLTISYTNHKNIVATETLFFDPNGKVYLAAACHKRSNMKT